jgi:hypothetical protein
MVLPYVAVCCAVCCAACCRVQVQQLSYRNQRFQEQSQAAAAAAAREPLGTGGHQLFSEKEQGVFKRRLEVGLGGRRGKGGGGVILMGTHIRAHTRTHMRTQMRAFPLTVCDSTSMLRIVLMVTPVCNGERNTGTHAHTFTGRTPVMYVPHPVLAPLLPVAHSCTLCCSLVLRAMPS